MIAISQADAAETSTVLATSAIAARARSDSSFGAVTAHTYA
ncbi:hypothetical protein [Sporichthya sp.]|nr:hypothetical protein [Sporichthya sp.]